jgi:hypothetical protein
VLSHTFTGRPLSAAHLLPLYLEHPAPRPNLIYLPNASPPTLVFSLKHADVLFLVTASSEVESLLVLEFLHRVVDAFEDFLGAPLLAVKIENNYDVAAQLLTEMCDSGIINTTEPNALREVVEVEGWVGKLLGSINLPGYGHQRRRGCDLAKTSAETQTFPTRMRRRFCPPTPRRCPGDAPTYGTPRTNSTPMLSRRSVSRSRRLDDHWRPLPTEPLLSRPRCRGFLTLSCR